MKIIRDHIPSVPGQVFTPDGRANSVYLGELFDAIAKETSARLRRRYRAEIPLSGGLWGGSWFFADEKGYTRARFRRLYSIVCVPQIPALNDSDNYNQVFQQYINALHDGFASSGIEMHMAQYGEPVQYSNRLRPTISFQMWDANQKIDYIRSFFVYNSAEWEEAYLYETVWLIKQAKEALDNKAHSEAPKLEGMPTRYQLQDIVILYCTLEPVLSEETKAIAAPLVERIKARFSQGMKDEAEMNALNAEAFKSGLIYGYADALREDFSRDGLDIDKIEEWPIEYINRIPETLKIKLVPPLKAIFQASEQIWKPTKQQPRVESDEENSSQIGLKEFKMPQWLDDMTNAGEPGIPKMLRDLVWERDEAQCTKCGATEDIDVYCTVPYGMPTENNSKIMCKACKRLL